MAYDELPDDPSLADPLPESPLPTLGRWLEEAVERGVQRNPLAIALATADADGRAEARMLLTE